MRSATLLLLLAAVVAGRASAAEWYVSPAGNDGWSGRLATPNRAKTDGPFATPGRARDEIRKLKAAGQLAGGATVLLREGLYCLKEPLALGPEDSGSADAPVVYRAFGKEKPILSGGRVITGWKEVPGAQPRRWQAVIPEVKSGAWNFRQLFAQRKGESIYTRRFRPHKGMLVVAGLTWSPARKAMAHRAAQNDFIFYPGDLQAWKNPKDLEVVALHSWSASRLKIAEVDAERRVVRLTSTPTFRIGHWYSGGRNPYYIENVGEELKHPGEWYLDRSTGTLTYLPLPGETPANTTLVAPYLEKPVLLKGDAEKGALVEHVRFEGLGFRHSEWPVPDAGYDVSQGQPTLPAAIELTGARACAFTRCTFANTGAYGIGIGQGCAGNSVIGCLFYDLGGGGVKVGDSGMKQDAQPPVLPTDNVVENNLITDTGVIHYSANGIWCGIVKGTRIRHNEVRRNPYTGIAVGWNWSPTPTSCAANLIEANHVHHVMQLVQDGGGIYTLGRQPGTTIRGNLIHDSVRGPFACDEGQVGLYFDEGSTGFLVEDNVVYDVAWENCKIAQNRNKAEDHTIRNNSLAIRPGDPKFPKAIAARAGLEPPFRNIEDASVRVTPNPVYAMKLPVLPPMVVGFDYSFEEMPLGALPREFSGAGFTDAARFEVTEEAAASGRRCLKIRDAASQARPFYPYASYGGYKVEKGKVRLSFDVMQSREQPGQVEILFRDYANKGTKEYLSGPSLQLHADGKLTSGGKEVAALPAGQWARVELGFTLGAGAAREASLTVTLPDKSPRTVQVPIGDDHFAALTSFMIIGSDEKAAVTYLDNLKLTVEE